MGLTAGPVPQRVSGPVKIELIGLAEHAVAEGGFSLRWAARALGVDHVRLLARKRRQADGDTLDDGMPGAPAGDVLHALLDWGKDAVVDVAKDWAQVDLSHRKLAHRTSRLAKAFVSEYSVLRVLTDRGWHLPGLPQIRERRKKRDFPDWVEPVPGQIYVYDFPHFRGLKG